MQLLNGATTVQPQFVALSLVLNTTEEDAASSVQMVTPLMVSAPLATVQQQQALEALQELHFHLNSTIQAATEVIVDLQDQISMTLFKEDARQMEDVQWFAPSAASGLGLYYRLIRTDHKATVAHLANLILQASKANAKAPQLTTGMDSIWGFLLTTGLTGMPLATLPSHACYQLSERVGDVKEILTKRAQDLGVQHVKTLLSTFLLMEDDARLTNSRLETIRLTRIAEPEDDKKKEGGFVSPLGVRMAKRKGDGLDGPAGEEEEEREDPVLALDLHGAEETRLVMERLKVLSVAESKTLLQKYTQKAFERKANLDLTGGTGKGSRFSSRKRSSGRDADLDNFDYKGPTRGESAQTNPLAAAGFVPTASSFLAAPAAAGGAKSLPLKQPAKDTKLKTAGLLSAPRNDVGDRRRRGGAGGGGSANLSSHGGDDAATTTTAGSGSTKSFDPFGPSTFSPQPQAKGKLDAGLAAAAGLSSGGLVDYEDATVASQVRVQVNVALNEDLSCSYRSSQISSCSVEGVVQVQVKSSGSNAAPFYLLLRDAAEQVESFSENKKYCQNVSNTLQDQDDADCKYTITVPPQSDSYFPVVRYKCVEDLRPVPIRVQTRAKTENGHCRVALQISSNPNNEAKLTDLTIIMGVPEDINGETLVTQPAGGVWNDGKRCVTWCVEELEKGEKFQLQARFQLTPNATYEQSGDKPLFPVLVRCQCLFAQLSGLELEIRDIPETFPADVTMKIARRFRLSHRERA